MHKVVKIASDEKTVELINTISDEIQSVLEKFNKDDLKELIETIVYKQNQQREILENVSEDISSNEKNVMQKIDTVNKILLEENNILVESALNNFKLYKDDVLNLQSTLNTLVENQARLIEKVSKIEETQNKPWYNKLIRS